VLEQLEAQEWIRIDDRACRLTLEGMLFLDRIVDELVELVEPAED
jgi:hypothetical protein